MTKNSRRYVRNEFKPGTWVKLISDIESSYPKSYLIIDISVGGLGLVSISQNEMKTDENYYILDVDGVPLSKKVKMKVVYVNSITGPENRFRVGCEFMEITSLNQKMRQ